MLEKIVEQSHQPGSRVAGHVKERLIYRLGYADFGAIGL
jgi:hypothetical protein